MKKIISLLIIMTVTLTLIGCKDNKKEPEVPSIKGKWSTVDKRMTFYLEEGNMGYYTVDSIGYENTTFPYTYEQNGKIIVFTLKTNNAYSWTYEYQDGKLVKKSGYCPITVGDASTLIRDN